MENEINQFIKDQRKSALNESDPAVAYGMGKVLDGLTLLSSSKNVTPMQDKVGSEGKYMSVREAADYLRVSTTTIRKWKLAGKLDFRQIGGKWGKLSIWVPGNKAGDERIKQSCPDTCH